MSLRIGSKAPDFKADTTEGTISFHDWIGDGWCVMFSHPKDFTPVCTTELGYMAGLKPEFDKRNCKILGLSVDPVEDHKKWSVDIQRNLGQNLALKVGYVGSKGSQLGVGGTNNSTVNINQLDPSFLSLGGALDDPIQNPFFGQAEFGQLSNSPTLPRGQLLRPFPQFQDVLAKQVLVHRDYPGSRSLTVSRSLRSSSSVAATFSWAKAPCSIPATMLQPAPDVVSGKPKINPSSTS